MDRYYVEHQFKMEILELDKKLLPENMIGEMVISTRKFRILLERNDGIVEGQGGES